MGRAGCWAHPRLASLMDACTHPTGLVAFLTPNHTRGGWKGHWGWGSRPLGQLLPLDGCAGRATGRPGRLAAAGYGGACPRTTLAHRRGRRERLTPGALPERGNPICAQLCFWDRIWAHGPRRGSACSPSAALAKVAELGLCQSPCQSCFPAKRLPMRFTGF